MTDGTNIAITNETARIVGLIAKQHPECAVQIAWTEGSDITLWSITATDGEHDYLYVVDDEQGTWAPATESEAAAIDAGEPLTYPPDVR